MAHPPITVFIFVVACYVGSDEGQFYEIELALKCLTVEATATRLTAIEPTLQRKER